MCVLEFISIFLFGALGYGGIEMLWRGYTHWTMLLTGGVCFCVIYAISTRMRDVLWKKWVMCASCVSALEFAVGCIVNLRLGWAVWDYSNMKFNLMGQICPLFMLFWFLLSIPAVAVSRFLKKWVFVKAAAAQVKKIQGGS